MHYDFDALHDRRGTNALKYDARKAVFGRDDVIPLWVADMDFQTAQPIIDAVTQKAAEGIYGYAMRPDSYFDAVRDWQAKRNAWSPDTTLMSVCPGVVPALAGLVQQFSNVGDAILIQPPVYPQFESVIRTANREPLACPLVERDDGYAIDFDAFEAALAQKPALFILCHPHNPVGRVWTREELARMSDRCAAHGVRLIADEIHADLMLRGQRHIPMASLSDETAARTITCLSGTKTFNLAGLHASTVVFPNAEDKRRFDALWEGLHFTDSNAFSLPAMEAAFRQGEDWLDQLLPYIEGNVDYVCDFLRDEIPGIRARRPDATYLVWLDCRGFGMDDDALSRFMVEKAGLGLNAGRAFGANGSGFMRLNAACPRSVLETAMRQLKAAVDARV